MVAKSKMILIAEDDPFLIKVMGTLLEDEGLTVDRAHDGEEAIKKLQTGKYSLVLLDLIMPGKTGFEVLEEAKKMKIKTPILVFSNLSQEEDKQRVKALGAKGYYVKSDISVGEVAAAVKKYV